MAKASPEEPVEAPEPKKAAEPKPSVGTWPKSEHILHATAMYNHPVWLVEHVLSDVEDDVLLSEAEVTGMIHVFLSHEIRVEG